MLVILKIDRHQLDVALVVSYRIVALVFSYIWASEQLVHVLIREKYRREIVRILLKSVACSWYFCVQLLPIFHCARTKSSCNLWQYPTAQRWPWCERCDQIPSGAWSRSFPKIWRSSPAPSGETRQQERVFHESGNRHLNSYLPERRREWCSAASATPWY